MFGKILEHLGRAVAVVRAQAAIDEILPEKTLRAEIDEPLYLRLARTHAPGRTHDPNCAVVQPVAEGIHEIDCQIEILHESGHFYRAQPSHPERHPHRMRDLYHALPAAGDLRIRVRVRFRAGDREREHLGVLLGISAQVRLHHRREYARHELNPPQLARLDDAARGHGVPGEMERVSHHQVQTIPLGPPHKIPSIHSLQGHGFLYENVHPRVQSISGDLVVVGMLHRNHDAVDSRC